MSQLDLKAVEALSELISVPPEGLNDYEIDERLSKLWLAAPELLALAKIGLAAMDWLEQVSKEEVTIDDYIDGANDFRALVAKHQSGGGG